MRSTLVREWDERLPGVVFIGCNPGLADAVVDDATARKYVGFASRWGFGWYVAGNLWQWVATDQRALIARVRAGLPVNPAEPDDWLRHVDLDRVAVACYAYGRTLAAIGAQWASRVVQATHAVEALGCRCVVAARNRDGSPTHLSRLPYSTAPVEVTP